MNALGLKLGASLLTLVSLAGSTSFVVGHVKNPDAPLHPPVVRPAGTRPAPTPSTRLHLEPSVRVTELAPLTFTYVS